MNLNDFVVIPNTKAKSTKLNGRKLQELRMETVTLAQESEWMEQRLQQLKESMIREKQERGRPEGYRWKSGKAGTMTNPSSANRNKEYPPQTLAPGRLKIRLLKEEPLKAPVPPASQPTPTLASGRKQRLRGKICGQCEVMAAGLACPECGEDYCVGCFTKFHQKGALKLHRMVPIQAELQTHVSTLAVVSSFRRQVNPGARPRAPAPTKAPTYSTADQYLIPRPHLHADSHGGPHHHHQPQPQPSPPGPRRPGVDTDPPAAASGRSRKAKGEGRSPEPIRGWDRPADPALYHTEHVKVNNAGDGGDQGATDTEEEDEEEDDSSGDGYDDEDNEREMEEGQEGVEGISLLDGVYDEEDSALGFQKALREWRGQGTGEMRRSGSSGGGEEHDERGLRPTEDPPVAMAAIGTQAGLPPNRGPEGGGGGGGEGRGGGGGGEGGERVPVNVVFQDDSLCYLDRLLLKNHRRTPIKLHRLNSDPGLDSTLLAHTQDGPADRTLTAEDEDFRRYYASLFAVPTTRGSVGPTSNSPVSCLTIEVLNESSEELPETTGGEPTIDRSAMRPSGQCCSNKESEAGALVGPLQLHSFTSGRSGPAKHSSVSADSTEYKSLRTQLSTKQFSSSRGPTGAYPRAAETTTESPRRPASTSPGSPVPPSARVHESQAPAPSSPTASLRLSSRSLPPCPAASPLCPNTRGSPPPTHLSLRSTFTLTPLTSVDVALLPEVDPETLPPAAAGVEGPASRAASSLRGSADSALSPGRWRSTHPLPPVPPVSSDPEERPPTVTSPPTGGPPSHLPSSPEVQTPSPSPPKRSSPSPVPPSGLTDQGGRPVGQGGRRSGGSSVNHPPAPAPFTPGTAAEPWRVRASTPDPEDPLVSRPSELARGGRGSSLPSYPDLHCFQDDPPSRDNGRPGGFIQTDEETSGTGDAEDDMSIDSLGLTLHDGASSDEDELEEDGGGSGEWRWRDEDLVRASNATSEGSLVPEGSGSEQEPDAETGEAGFQSKPSRALQALAQRASSGQERRGGGLDGFLTLGLDLQSTSYGGPPEHTEPNEENQRDPMQPPGPDTFHPGAVSWRPSSSLRARAQEHLVSTVMKDSQSRPTGVQHRSAPPTVRRDISTYKPGLSGSPRYPLSARSTSARRPAPAEELSPLLSLSRLPPPSLSGPCSGGVSLRPVSRAAQEIQDISGVDRASGEDPREDADAEALTRLEEELRLMVHDTSARPALIRSAGHGAQGQRRTKDLTWGGVSEEQKQEEEEVARDHQSVLSLP
ncbi:protein PRRC2A isoform X2 [Gadus morhua]|uniref:protein PRRC2A isoform X2 n=1 Tax=Gadus morhua TaxID=8049 RepID=UPI0011B74D31|nr:zinc finger B-box domain-containing protein 1 isoform X2 [Gadus morhua]